MAKRRPRKGEFLLCRDYRGGSMYKEFSLLSRVKLVVATWVDDGRRYWQSKHGWGPIHTTPARMWHRRMPKELHLKPGGGPIRIRVEVVK